MPQLHQNYTFTTSVVNCQKNETKWWVMKERISRVQNRTLHITTHFKDEPFHAINCSVNDNQT